MTKAGTKKASKVKEELFSHVEVQLERLWDRQDLDNQALKVNLKALIFDATVMLNEMPGDGSGPLPDVDLSSMMVFARAVERLTATLTERELQMRQLKTIRAKLKS